ncbi:hypothetical protein TKK_0015469 [Trichogramma kaykai]
MDTITRTERGYLSQSPRLDQEEQYQKESEVESSDENKVPCKKSNEKMVLRNSQIIEEDGQVNDSSFSYNMRLGNGRSNYNPFNKSDAPKILEDNIEKESSIVKIKELEDKLKEMKAENVSLKSQLYEKEHDLLNLKKYIKESVQGTCLYLTPRTTLLAGCPCCLSSPSSDFTILLVVLVAYLHHLQISFALKF